MISCSHWGMFAVPFVPGPEEIEFRRKERLPPAWEPIGLNAIYSYADGKIYTDRPEGSA